MSASAQTLAHLIQSIALGGIVGAIVGLMIGLALVVMVAENTPQRAKIEFVVH